MLCSWNPGFVADGFGGWIGGCIGSIQSSCGSIDRLAGLPGSMSSKTICAEHRAPSIGQAAKQITIAPNTRRPMWFPFFLCPLLFGYTNPATGSNH
jgi:hypothetical protein